MEAFGRGVGLVTVDRLGSPTKSPTGNPYPRHPMNETPPNEVPMEGDYESPEEFFRAVDMGRAWFKDSSLEKWFPFTARELTTLREKVKRLEAGGVTTSDFLTPIERQRDQLEIENHRLKSRIRELEEAFPEPNVLRAISNAFTPQYPQDGLKAIVCRMADRIEKVMTKQPSEK